MLKISKDIVPNKCNFFSFSNKQPVWLFGTLEYTFQSYYYYSFSLVGDGNCFFWSILDQITYDDELSREMIQHTRTVWTMREFIVLSVDEMINSGQFSADFFTIDDDEENDEYDSSLEQWKRRMINRQEIEYADDRCYELASLLLKRTIILYPVIIAGYGSRTYHPEFLANGPSLHLLYFSEVHFSDGHFQSIRHKQDNNANSGNQHESNHGDEIPSSSGNIPPSNNDGIPSSDSEMPRQENPSNQNEMPQFDGNIELPSDNFNIPSGDFEIPRGNFDIPRSNFDIPSGNFDIPSGNFDIPSGNFDNPSDDTF